MISIKKINDNIAIDNFGQTYEIKQDSRGLNEKLWIQKSGGQFQDSYLIKFSTRPEEILSDLNLYNEVVCSNICKALGIDHVNYELCNFENTDGTSKLGVISANYKESPEDVEMNGKSLHESYCDWLYDNSFGKTSNEPVNTVYTFIKELKVRFESKNLSMSEEMETQLTEQLITLAIFDFCICQIDRHWGNVGWLHNNDFESENFRISLLPIYDNECSFLLDDITEKDLAEMLSNIRSGKNVQKVIDKVNKKKFNAPYLGIKTALVRVKENSNGFLVPLSNIIENVSNVTFLAREISDEIKSRENIKKLYEKISTFNISQFLDELNIIPESQEDIKEVYSFVWNTRVKLLKDTVKNEKKNPEGAIENEAGLS